MTADEKINAVEEATMDAELKANDMLEQMRLDTDEEGRMMEQTCLAVGIYY